MGRTNKSGDSKKNTNRRKVPVIVAILLLVVVGIFGTAGTLAWNSHNLEVINDLKSRTVSVEINETCPDKTVTPESTKTKQVKFKNTGSDAAFVRMAFSENWQTADELISGDTAVAKNWASDFATKWVQMDDGWYYYKKVLPAGADTGAVLESITFPAAANVPDGADYSLYFQVETLQVSDEADVNTQATQEVFGKTGVVSNAAIENGAVISGDVAWS